MITQFVLRYSEQVVEVEQHLAQLEQALSVVTVEVQGKFYVGEVVVPMLEVVVVDIVGDLLLHLISAKVAVAAEPQVVSGVVTFRT